MKYQHIIVYSQGRKTSQESDSCILRNNSNGFCAHPFTTQKTIKCNYDLTDIKVQKSAH